MADSTISSPSDDLCMIEPIALICVVNGPKELLDLKASLAQATFASVSEDAVPS